MKRDLSEGANGTSRGTGGPTGLFARLERAVQRGFGYLEGTANLRNGVLLIAVECLGNTEFSVCQGFRPAAFPSSRSGCQKGGLPFLASRGHLRTEHCPEISAEHFICFKATENHWSLDSSLPVGASEKYIQTVVESSIL